ncbi:MAG: hypothetical protein J7M08_08080, partial [Planctomycetes bacterium]|nr:hypothetical protein [Planctomycetota bacterium]
MAWGSVRRFVEDGRLLFWLTLIAVFLAFLGPLVAYDVWWHMKAGELILRTGAVPHVDPFSFTAGGNPWVYHSWLAGVIFRMAEMAGGLGAVVALRSLLLAASLMICWATARRRGVSPALASVLTLVVCLQLRTRALARPYLFSFVFFAVFAMLLRGAVGPPAGA